MNRKTVGAIAIILAAVLWAFDGAFLLPEIRFLDVNSVVFILHLIPFLIMSIVFIPFLKTIKKDIKSLKFVDWTAFIAVAFFGGYLGTYAITQAFFNGYAEGSNITVVFLLQKLQPVFAILLAVIFLKEKPTKNYWFWAILALIGSYILTFGFDKPNLSLENKALVAALFSIMAAFSFGSGTVFSKRALKKVSFTTGTYLRFALTAVLSAVIVLLFSDLKVFSDISNHQWWIFLVIAVTTGGGAIWLYYWGLKKVKASASTIYEMALPVSGALFDYFYHDHLMDGVQFFGGGLLIGAVLMMVREKKKYIDLSVSGKVISGFKKGAEFVEIYKDKISKQLGFVPFLGTLNVELGEDFEMPKKMKGQFIKEFKTGSKKYGKVYYLKGEINTLDCVLVLPEKTTHDKRVLEIISPYNLRKELCLENAESVEINYEAS